MKAYPSLLVIKTHICRKKANKLSLTRLQSGLVWSGTILLANAFPVLRNLVLALKELSVDVG